MFNVCQIGLGSISNYWVYALQKRPEQFKLVAICDIRKPQNVEKYGDAIYYEDYHDCCKSDKIDVVIISTPPGAHLPIILCALENKKKVIVEKPITTTREDTMKCIEAAKATNTHLYFAYHSKFAPSYLKAKQIINNLIQNGDSLTEVKGSVELNVKVYINQPWIWDKSMSGGGILIDGGINIFSCLLDMVGPVKITSADLHYPTSDPNAVEDIVDSIFVNEQGVTGRVYFNWAFTGGDVARFSIAFKSGTKVLFEWCTGELIVIHPDNTEERSIVDVREKEIDKGMVPMGKEYFIMLGDIVEFFRKPVVVDNTWLYPVNAVFDTYAIAKHHVICEKK